MGLSLGSWDDEEADLGCGGWSCWSFEGAGVVDGEADQAAKVAGTMAGVFGRVECTEEVEVRGKGTVVVQQGGV